MQQVNSRTFAPRPEAGTQLDLIACDLVGSARFAEWITAMAINVEEHTITQSVLALEQFEVRV